MPVHFSHCATDPRTSMELEATFRIWAPSFQCTRSQGSKGAPSSRRQRMYRSIGVRGYKLLRLGRTGAIRWAYPRALASAFITETARLLIPFPRCVRATITARAQRVFGE